MSEEKEEVKKEIPTLNDQEEQSKKRKLEVTMPKKPLSSYMIFCSEKREEIKTQNPQLKFTEVAKELGMRWKALGDAEKRAYDAKSTEQKRIYEENLKIFNETYPNGLPEEDEEDFSDEEEKEESDHSEYEEGSQSEDEEDDVYQE